jgi:predicted RNA-binding protein YlqC (UPF0109 family)
MTDMDQAFVEYVVKALVSNPDAVVVKRSVDDMGVLLELTVDPADMGKVIGKAGATAKSIRTLLRVLGAKNDARVNLKIVEPEGAEPREVAEANEVFQAEEPVAEATEAPVEAEAEPAGEDLRAKTAREMADLTDLDI